MQADDRETQRFPDHQHCHPIYNFSLALQKMIKKHFTGR